MSLSTSHSASGCSKALHSRGPKKWSPGPCDAHVPLPGPCVAQGSRQMPSKGYQAALSRGGGRRRRPRQREQGPGLRKSLEAAEGGVTCSHRGASPADLPRAQGGPEGPEGADLFPPRRSLPGDPQPRCPHSSPSREGVGGPLPTAGLDSGSSGDSAPRAPRPRHHRLPWEGRPTAVPSTYPVRGMGARATSWPGASASASAVGEPTGVALDEAPPWGQIRDRGDGRDQASGVDEG